MIRVSVEEQTLTIHVGVENPITIEIEHPLVGVLSQVTNGSLKNFDLHPLYIVEDRSRDPSKNSIATNNTANPSSTAAFQLREEEHTLPPVQLPQLLKSIIEGLDHHSPVPCEIGVNGTYFLKDKNGDTAAIFKPSDEEGSRSPKKAYEDIPFVDRGIADGEGVQREVAAFLLDHDHFSGVPETLVATFDHFTVDGTDCGTKTGSLQAFVENDGSTEDFGPAAFPIHQVHKIGVLDLRIFNNDRHSGNILLREGPQGYELIPIDHGLSLSPNFQHGWFDWLMWPQAKQPFDQETRDYIARLDVEKDAQILRDLGLNEECIQTMKISTTLLKKGTLAGLSLYDIGSMASRMDPDEPSELEKMIEQAKSEGGDDQTFTTTLYRIMDSAIQREG